MSDESITVWNYDEFCEADLSTTYIVDPILPRGGIGIVYGIGGQGKTQLVFELMRAVTEGDHFLKRWPTEPGTVLFIQADMPIGLFQERAQKAQRGLGARERIKLRESSHLDIVHSEADQRFIRRLVGAADPDLIIFDTLHKLHYEDENDSKSSALVYGRWQQLVGPEVTTVFIHHARQAIYDFKRSEYLESDDDLRGHGSWAYDSDMAIRMKKWSEGDVKAAKKQGDPAPKPEEEWVKMHFSRLRCRPQKDMDLRFNPETLIIEPTESQKAHVRAEQLLALGVDPEDLGWKLHHEEGFSKTHAYRTATEVKEGLTAAGAA